MSLRPAKTIHKILFSTTSRLVGEYESNGLLVAHAWPDLFKNNITARLSEGPTSRSSFFMVFESKPVEEREIVIPDYSPTGDVICSYLAVLFGKRFDSHGRIESNGFFYVPDLTQFGHLCDPRSPNNSHSVRVDFPIPLNLEEIKRIDNLIHAGTSNLKFSRTFQSASKFYLQAIQNAELDPEVSYLHLITACEILSNYQEFDTDFLLDVETKSCLEIIRNQIVNGEKIAKFFTQKFFSVKKKFTETIIGLIDQDFFLRSESNEEFAKFKSETFRSCISAAYDLRSKYVHTGMPFGRWIKRFGECNHEVQMGKPVVSDKEFGKILAKAPTYVGLERIVRYCLLQFAKNHGVYVDPTQVEVERNNSEKVE